MPKLAYDFSKEMLFYMIKCNDESVEEVYVGSTFDFTKRKTRHKTNCNNEKNASYNIKIYQTIRANGGWDNWNMNVIERKVCIDKLEARQHEQTLIEKHNAKLNSQRAYTDKKEYQKEYRKEYNETHKEERKEYMKEYNETHKEERKEYQKEYTENHREEYLAYLKKYSKNYYDLNKEKRKAQMREYSSKMRASIITTI